MSLIKIRQLWKSFGDQVVLEKLNLDVEQGEFCTLVGASGCGKTTFLRMLLGEEQQTRGALLLDDKPMPHEPGPERGIVFQRYSVFPHLSVLRNVMLGPELQQSRILGRVWGAKRTAVREEALALLEQVGLSAAKDRYPSELSGGMQQRLAIAQALIMKPRVLLLDEPFGALDPGIRADMHVLVRDLWQRNKLTVFMVTHDLGEAFALGTRMLVFDKVRRDSQAPNAYGATITYDLPLLKDKQHLFSVIEEDVEKTRQLLEKPCLEGRA